MKGDTGTIVTNNIRVEVVVLVDSQNIEFIDCRFIGKQDTRISFLSTNFTVHETAIGSQLVPPLH